MSRRREQRRGGGRAGRQVEVAEQAGRQSGAVRASSGRQCAQALVRAVAVRQQEEEAGGGAVPAARLPPARRPSPPCPPATPATAQWEGVGWRGGAGKAREVVVGGRWVALDCYFAATPAPRCFAAALPR